MMQFLLEQSNVAIATIAVAIILGLASIGYGLLTFFQPTRNLPKIGSWLRFLWLLTGVFLVSAIYNRNILLFYIAFITYLAFKEFLSITPTRRADRRVLFWAYLAIPIQFYFIWTEWFEAFIIFVPVYIFLVIPFIMVIIGETQGFLRASSTLGWGIVVNIYSMGHLAYLLVLPVEGNPPSGGMGLFLFLTILAQMNHAAQFVFGRLFDHPKLRLKVSQTRNGGSLIGSLITSAVVAWLSAQLLTPLTELEAILAGLLVGIGGFIGYITMTALKRDLQLKDRGSMTPGQGGVLNRIATLIYNAPLFFHLIYYLHY